MLDTTQDDALRAIRAAVGDAHVLTGADAAPWARDWPGRYSAEPLAVARPRDTAQVAAVMRAAHAARMPVTAVSGNTGLNGGAISTGLIVSLDRLGGIEVTPSRRTATVGAGVVLQALHDAADAHGLVFPMTFGARGSARIGGMLSTNAGGSNVLRYGSMRDLCLGVEVVTADGTVVDLMGALHKDNSGYALRDLMIGAEGTLGIVTAAVLKLHPRPAARATAMVGMRDLGAALALLHDLQDATGGLVEAFEFMPEQYIAGHLSLDPDARQPFAQRHAVNVLVELGATAPHLTGQAQDGSIPLDALLEEGLAVAMENGQVQDAILSRSDAQRAEMWRRRELAAEIQYQWTPNLDNDVALPLDRVAEFFDLVRPRTRAIDPDVRDMSVAHLGDGNVHYTLYPSSDDTALADRLRDAVEGVVAELRGSFSAEHGIGTAKLGTMRRRKDPGALQMMRAIKTALDPHGILNPGKTVPDP
ncbi:MAG: FAD-binding oxidoreductase [Paracoccaceae bacterium]